MTSHAYARSRPMTSHPTKALRTLLLGLVLVGCVLAQSASPLLAANGFYTQMLEQGKWALRAGDPQNAAQKLRLACFGLLDEPDILADGLVHLAVAQADLATAQLGAWEEFSKTLDRIFEVEQRFTVYSDLDLDPGMAQRFEELLVAHASYRSLRLVPVFSSLAKAAQARTLVTTPLNERFTALDRLLKEEPEEILWQILRMEAELESGDYNSASERALALRNRQMGDNERQRVHCVLGQAEVALKRCATALPSLEICDPRVERAKIVTARLDCHIELDQWDAATAVLSRLTPALANDSEIQRRRRSVLRNQRAEEPSDEGNTP